MKPAAHKWQIFKEQDPPGKSGWWAAPWTVVRPGRFPTAAIGPTPASGRWTRFRTYGEALSCLNDELPTRDELSKRHDWAREPSGRIDFFRLDAGHCNGPECLRCGDLFCEHCKPEIWDEECPSSQLDLPLKP